MKELTGSSPDSVLLAGEFGGEMDPASGFTEQVSTKRTEESPPVSRKLFHLTEKGMLPHDTTSSANNQQQSVDANANSPSQPLPHTKRPSSLKQPSAPASRYRSPRVADAKDIKMFARTEPKKKRSVPPEQQSCHAGLTLTAKQLTDLFAMFDDVRRDLPTLFHSAAEKPTSGSVGSTAIAGNLSTDRQLAMNSSILEDGIIEKESMIAMKLKSEIASLRESSLRVVQEMELVQTKLFAVSRERDALKTRESTLEEKIQALQTELENARISNGSSLEDTRMELDRLRVENELFAAQIVENEVEMREIRTILGFMDKENDLMRSTLEALESKAAKERAEAEETAALSAQIDTLMNRISEIERLRYLDRKSVDETVYPHNTRANSELQPMIVSLQSEACCATLDPIEVAIYGAAAMKPTVEIEAASGNCCDFFHANQCDE